MRFWRVFGATVLAVASLTCTEREGKLGKEAAQPVVFDSAGVNVIENRVPAVAQDNSWGLDRIPTVVVGEAELGQFATSDRLVLSGLVGAVFVDSSSSRLIVTASNSAQEICAYTLEAERRYCYGVAGDGPGEFRLPSGIAAYRSDSVVVLDIRRRKVVVLDATKGEFGREFRLDVPAYATAVYNEIAGVLRDGSVVLHGLHTGSVEPGPRVLPRRVARFGPQGEFEGLWREVEGLELHYTRVGGGLVWARPPFHRRSFAITVGDRLLIANSGRFSYSVYDARGRLRLIVRRDYRNEHVTKELIDAFLEAKFAHVRGSAGREKVLDRQREMVTHSKVPAIAKVITDDESRVWVRHYRSRPAATADSVSVFSKRGHWVGGLEIPASVTITDVADELVLGIRNNESGSQSVVVYEVQRSL